jgi:hypothetical protein
MADHTSNFDGLSSLISFAGFTIPARAKFVAQFVGSSLLSSLTLGLVAGQAGATFLSAGPLIPFMTGSWIGYTWGCIGFWRQSKRQMLECAKRYPEILVHSLVTKMSIMPPNHLVFDGGSETNRSSEGSVSLEEWIVQGGIGRTSYAILAAQSCEEDVQELHRSERQRIIDKYNNRHE